MFAIFCRPSAEVLPQLSMLPEEEPEQQLLHVSEAQLTEHIAAQKAAADKAAGLGALGGFVAAAGGPGKAAAGAAAGGAKADSPPKQQQQQQRHAEELHSVRELSEPERCRLQVEREQLCGKCWRHRTRSELFRALV